MNRRLVSEFVSNPWPRVELVVALNPQRGDVPIRIALLNKRITVLCPVDKLNNVPKGLGIDVMGDFTMGNDFVTNHGLITPRGIIVLSRTAMNKQFTGLFT